MGSVGEHGVESGHTALAVIGQFQLQLPGVECFASHSGQRVDGRSDQFFAGEMEFVIDRGHEDGRQRERQRQRRR